MIYNENYLKSLQVDGGISTPPNELEDISEFGMFFSQVDGGDDEDEKLVDANQKLNEAVEAAAGDAAASADDTSTVFVKEETPDNVDNKDDKNKDAEQPEVKNEPSDANDPSVMETKRTPVKDPLAEAMNEVRN